MFKSLLNRKFNLVALIVLVHLLSSYYYFPRYYSSAIGTCLIVFLSWLAWKKETFFWIGLQLNSKKILFTLLSFVTFLIGSYLLIKLAYPLVNPCFFKKIVISLHVFQVFAF